MAARANSWPLGNARGATVHQGEHHSALRENTTVHQTECKFTGGTPFYTKENTTVH